MAEERLEDITRHILKNHRKKTQNQQYTASFTVQSIKMAIKYYDLFKQYAEGINVATIFTYGANEPETKIFLPSTRAIAWSAS